MRCQLLHMPIFGHALYKADNARQNFDPQFFHKKRHVFHKDTQEPRVEVPRGKCLKVMIRGSGQVAIKENLTARCLSMIAQRRKLVW